MNKHSFSEVWKRFEQQPLTHSMAHYLLAVSELRDQRGYARITDVARRLGVTKGSASIAIKVLREKGFVTEDENRMLFLTADGEHAVTGIVGSRSAFLEFFHNVLGVDETIALEDSCKLEHLISHITTARLGDFARFMLRGDGQEALAKFTAQATESPEAPKGSDPTK